MRPSSKTAILDAAVAVVEAHGITAVTFDSIAAASGITRGGILYHFRSRDELVGAIHEHVAEQWEQQLEAACGKTAAEATPTERLVAYVRVCATSATRADLQLLLDSTHGEHRRAWSRVMERWVPQSTDEQADAVDARTIALLAADGLWVSEAVGQAPIPRERRARIAERIVDLLHGATDR